VAAITTIFRQALELTGQESGGTAAALELTGPESGGTAAALALRPDDFPRSPHDRLEVA
jgi:hypothetical protein